MRALRFKDEAKENSHHQEEKTMSLLFEEQKQKWLKWILGLPHVLLDKPSFTNGHDFY